MMKAIPWIGLLLIVSGLAGAAPRSYQTMTVEGAVLTTIVDEFGSLTWDPDGLLLLEVDGGWHYARIDSSHVPAELVPIMQASPATGVESHLATRVDPVREERVRRFAASASPIVPVLGVVSLTIVLVEAQNAIHEARPQEFWWYQGQADQIMDPDLFHERFFLRDYSLAHPNDMNEAGYEIPGSAADWWHWSSQGRSSLQPDESRYPPNYVPPRPGWIVDPATGGPFVFPTSNVLACSQLWDSLASWGMDTVQDPRRPIVFLTRGDAFANASFAGSCALPMEPTEDSPLTIGYLLHELGHATLQLPDLYGVPGGGTHWQLMGMGGLGFFDPGSGLHNMGYPSDLSPVFKEMVGWWEGTPITIPGDFTLPRDGRGVVLANPADPAELLHVISWDPACHPGFLCRHQPDCGGRLLVFHTRPERPDWVFVGRPYPELVISASGSESWPCGDEHVLPMETWYDGTWFGWSLDLAGGSPGDADPWIRVATRPAPAPALVLLESPVEEEIPLGGMDVPLRLVNQGSPVIGWSLTLGTAVLSGNDTLSFLDTLEVVVPAWAWGAEVLGSRLDLPVELRSFQPDTVFPVAHLTPWVGLPEAGWSLAVRDSTLVAGHREWLVAADNGHISFFERGLELPGVELSFPVRRLFFSGGPEGHVALVGDDQVAVARPTSSGLVLEPGWPRELGSLQGALLADLPGLGWCLLVVSGSQLQGFTVRYANIVIDNPLPSYVLPVETLAYAGQDPAGFPGSRVAMTGGSGCSWFHVASLAGDSLFSHWAGSCGRIRGPWCLDVVGSGSYGFIAGVQTCSSTNFQEELWLVTYSQGDGHHGLAVRPLVSIHPGFDSGLESFTPVPLAQDNPRAAVVANLFMPASMTRSAIMLMDVGRPEIEAVTRDSGLPRRRWFLVTEATGDEQPDLLVVDRGEALRLWRHEGGLEFTDLGRLHRMVSLDRHPVACQWDGDLQLGFQESGRLVFHRLPGASWPVWPNPEGEGNRRMLAHANWPGEESAASTPRLTATAMANGNLVLQVDPLPPGQACARVMMWESNDRMQWNLLGEQLWDGLSTAQWVMPRAWAEKPRCFYRVTVDSVLDGNVIWSR